MNCRHSTDMEFNFSYTVFYEDEYLLIVNKPAGMLVHPTVKEVIKKYLGIVTGTLPADRGIIEAPISRKEGSIIERCVSPNGKYARTDYKLISRRKHLSLLELQLHTGRTHQIRVHMAHIGCPLYNDNLYGTPGPQSRHALHAYYLGFNHPATGIFLEISCALPNDLFKIIYY